jgi:hypothetical protein
MMPGIPVDEAPAGPAMDAAVAEALGWGYINSSRFGGWCWRYPDDITGWLYEKPPRFSTDIAAARGLWGGHITILKIGNRCQCILHPKYGYCIELLLSKATAEGYTAAHAICRAFLKANGIEYVEVTDGKDTG